MVHSSHSMFSLQTVIGRYEYVWYGGRGGYLGGEGEVRRAPTVSERLPTHPPMHQVRYPHAEYIDVL
jgi:hypothetical protein